MPNDIQDAVAAIEAAFNAKVVRIVFTTNQATYTADYHDGSITLRAEAK